MAANAPLAVDLATADHPGSLLGRPLIRLGGTRNTPTAGEVTPQAPSRIEARLLPEIDAVERRVLPRFISPLVAEGAGADAREWWAHLSIVQKRAVISTPTEIWLMKSIRGGGLSNLSVLRTSFGRVRVFGLCSGMPVAVTEGFEFSAWDGVKA